MKLPLATGVLSAACVAVPVSARTRGEYVFRVDRVCSHRLAPLGEEGLSGDDYVDAAPVDRWDVRIDGGAVVLSERRPDLSIVRRVEGHELPSDNGERRFALGTGALGESGRFSMRGDEAELTFYGTSVPILRSERGTLVPA